MKIGGNQAEPIPNLSIYPRTLDSYKKTQHIVREQFRNKMNKSKTKTLHDYQVLSAGGPGILFVILNSCF